MQCLLIADLIVAEGMLAALRAIDSALDTSIYAGGTLQRRRYELIVVASHLGHTGIALGGDNHLTPMALGNLAETAQAHTLYIASCDGPSAALEIAGQAKSTAIVYYGAALDGDTALRLATSFVERFVLDTPQHAIEVAQSAGYSILNPIWRPMATDGYGGNSEMTRLLLEMQRQQSETQADVRHLREDVSTLKVDVRRLGDAQVTQAQGVPIRNLMSVLAIVTIIVAFGWMAVYLLSGRAG